MKTDSDGATYEAHITKADGTHATVLLDPNFTVTATQDQGQAGPGGNPRTISRANETSRAPACSSWPGPYSRVVRNGPTSGHNRRASVA